MSKFYLPPELRQKLYDADDHRCTYCRTTEVNSGQPMTIDHIIPRAQGGKTTFENLCLACARCNEFKGFTTMGFDPLTGETVALFNPRTQRWEEHFAWDAWGVHLVGRTATGRATIVALNMNNDVIVDARRRWVSVGWHPPQE